MKPLLVSALFAGALTSCTDKPDDLGKQYRFGKFAAEQGLAVLRVSDGKPVVWPDIVSHRKVNGCVFGRREYSLTQMVPNDPDFTQNQGRFIMNMSDGRVLYEANGKMDAATIGCDRQE